ncbi:ATP-binding cassette domain-containing protein [Achromobacter aegrifaciens]|uniref:ATP-binding cassette domain-containing protein n=1 Tax=Achromobacter aegrifaciens TaxID=1287736 RepID=UPI003209EE41
MKNRMLLQLILKGGLRGKSARYLIGAASITLTSSILSALAPLLLAKITNVFLQEQNPAALYKAIAWLGGLYIGFVAFTKLLNTASLYLQSLLRIQFIETVSERYFTYLCARSAQFFVDHSVGSLAQQLNQATNDLYTIVRNVAFNITAPIIQLTIAIVVVSSALGAVVGSIFFLYVALFLINNRLFLKKLSPQHSLVMEAGRKSYATLVDSVINIAAVRQYNSFPIFFDRYRNTLASDRNIQNRYWRLTLFMLTINSLLFVAMFGLSIYWILHYPKNDVLTAGDFVLIATYVVLLSGPIELLGSTFGEVQQSWHSVKQFLSETFQANAVPPEIQVIARSEDAIIMEDVLFSYPSSSQAYLGPISLRVKSGERITITGQSGAGKSTLARLLTGEYLPSHGHISIFKRRLEDIGRSTLNDLIGVVSQDVCIFNDTLRFNMKIANADATDEQIIESLNLAGLPTQSHQLNLDTQLGDRGISVSGGQRQRIALARLFLRTPEIVIIDEGTSSLDVLTEKSISENLYAIFRNCTIISISHRLSTMDFSDRIILLKEGKIEDSGTIPELIQRSDYVRSLVKISSLKATDGTRSSR